MIGVIDLGIGNPKSLINVFSYLNIESELIYDVLNLKKCKSIILPGIGHFGAYVKKLQEQKFFDYLQTVLAISDIPFLGICVGAQALLAGSDEDDTVSGLNIFNGKSTRIISSEAQRVPNVGWRFIQYEDNSSRKGLDRFYFSHSYSMNINSNEVKAFTIPNEIVAIIQKGNITGIQFHPEKSGKNGINFLKVFSELSH